MPVLAPAGQPAAPVFQFSADLPRADMPQAVITAVSLSDLDGATRPSYVGGDTVVLEIEYRVVAAESPMIVVFEWRDRLGQLLFSDDTSLTPAPGKPALADQTMTARFTFDLPNLPPGDFALSAAVLHNDAKGFVIDDYRLDALVVFIEHQQSFGLVGATIAAVDLRILS
jgi:lipopolysaccharide transport system ATP-binding protein